MTLLLRLQRHFAPGCRVSAESRPVAPFATSALAHHATEVEEAPMMRTAAQHACHSHDHSHMLYCTRSN